MSAAESESESESKTENRETLTAVKRGGLEGPRARGGMASRSAAALSCERNAVSAAESKARVRNAQIENAAWRNAGGRSEWALARGPGQIRQIRRDQLVGFRAIGRRLTRGQTRGRAAR